MSRVVEKVLLALLPVPFGVALLAPGAAREPVDSEVVFAFADPEVVESSGLVLQDGLAVTVNDSGDSNRVFTIDPATGETVGVTRWQGEATDIEALAPAGDGHVWVGDIGDNLAARRTVTVTKVPVGRGDREVRAPSYRLAYDGGPRDAETLLTEPGTGRIYVVSKGVFGRVYAAPEELSEDRVNELEPVDEVLGIATDGAFFPDGRHVIIRNYTQAAVYTWPALDRVALLDLPSQQQGEGLAVTADGEVLLSSEGQAAEVLRVELPADVRAAVDGSATGAPADAATDGDSRADGEDGEDGESVPVRADERGWWPWALGGVVGAVIVVALLRSLRPR
ncbi:hypothetical protein L615_001400000480 [Nocardioides sp. J9]|uniref:WD40 repeat domain-containing protein n=1 Tax=Nocardioides sp. J9 TaxID=935844 RepID=UPI0011A57FC5|nr:WD40 repeat domain-containing protein [Nocardioides sp. J9]TWH01985.1 hypothetical protein L615_001400000480 [Nocardioides sp. J9]